MSELTVIDTELKIGDPVCLCRNCWVLFENLDDDCPGCSQKIESEPYAAWMKGMCSAQHHEMTEAERLQRSISGHHGKQTGPKTVNGKIISSMNRLTHGMYAKTHLLPRAKAGKLSACETCPFSPNGNNRCKNEKWIHCVDGVQELVAAQSAHLGGDMKALQESMADIHGLALYNLRRAHQLIAHEGLIIDRDVIGKDSEGNSEVITTVQEAHPALRGIEVLSRGLGGVGLEDFQLTPKSSGDGQAQQSISDAVNKLKSLFSPQELPEPVPAE